MYTPHCCRWRGAAPIQAAILAGDVETGVTIMSMDQGVDTGAMISQRTIKIEDDDSAGSLSEKLSHLGADLLIETLPRYLLGELKSQLQDENSDICANVKKEHGLLDFKKPVEELVRGVRAFNPWPAAYFEWNGGMLRIHRAHAEAGNASEGQRLIYRGQPAVGREAGFSCWMKCNLLGKNP